MDQVDTYLMTGISSSACLTRHIRLKEFLESEAL